MGEKFISVEEFLIILKKRWGIITSSFIICIAIAIVLSFFIITPKYEATTKLFIGKKFAGENQEYSPSDVIMYQNLMKTYSEIINTPDVLLKGLDKANLNLNIEEVISDLEVIAISDTQILEVKYRSEDPKAARDFIYSLTNEFINISEKLIPNGNVEILQMVRLPKDIVSPNKKINIVIGGFGGIVLGISLAFLMELIIRKRDYKLSLEELIDESITGKMSLDYKEKDLEE